MDMETICRRIHMPPEVTETLVSLDETLVFPDLGCLRDPEKWEEGLQTLKAALTPDPEGFRMLACMLRCAMACREDYEKLGLSEEIFFDTMGCFSRFVKEHMVSFGRYGFDRDFWTVRQVSAMLFRIGQLEYELLEEDGRKVVSIHIPSDCRLELPLLRASWEAARALIGKTFPDFGDVPYVCGSWLLSPNLKELLPPDSRILAFQRSFTVENTYAEPDFREWVFKRTDIPNEQLPENTSLQRNLKAFLLAGGTFLSGEGQLRPSPFLPES